MNIPSLNRSIDTIDTVLTCDTLQNILYSAIYTTIDTWAYPGLSVNNSVIHFLIENPP